MLKLNQINNPKNKQNKKILMIMNKKIKNKKIKMIFHTN